MNKPFKSFQGAIFDLDGTLLDSLGAWAEIDRVFFEKRGIPLPADYAETVKHLYLPEAAVYTKERFSLTESPEEIVAEWKRMTREFYAFGVSLKPFAKEYVQSLAAQGVKLGIATSSSPELFLAALERSGICGYFSATVTSEEVGRGKSFPDVYFEAARRLGVNPAECAVFEDVLTAVKCAHNAGFYTVAVFDEHSAHEERELRKNSDYFLHSFRELL